MFHEHVPLYDSFLGSCLTAGPGQPYHENRIGGGASGAGMSHSAPWAAPWAQGHPTLCVMDALATLSWWEPLNPGGGASKLNFILKNIVK